MSDEIELKTPAERKAGKVGFVIHKFDLAYIVSLFGILSNIGGLKEGLLAKGPFFFIPSAVLSVLDLIVYSYQFHHARNKNIEKIFDLVSKILKTAAIITAVTLAFVGLAVGFFGVQAPLGVLIFGGVIAYDFIVTTGKTIGFGIQSLYYKFFKDSPTKEDKYKGAKFGMMARSNLVFVILSGLALATVALGMIFPPFGIGATIVCTVASAYIFGVAVFKDTPIVAKLWKPLAWMGNKIKEAYEDFVYDGEDQEHVDRFKEEQQQEKSSGNLDSSDNNTTTTSEAYDPLIPRNSKGDKGENDAQPLLEMLPKRENGYFAALGGRKHGGNLDQAIDEYQTKLTNEIKDSKGTIKSYFFPENGKRRQKIEVLDFVKDKVAVALQNIQRKDGDEFYSITLTSKNVESTIIFRNKEEFKQKTFDYLADEYPESGQSTFKSVAELDELLVEKLDDVFEKGRTVFRNSLSA